MTPLGSPDSQPRGADGQATFVARPDLGPFSPPAEYAFEPEFLAPAPRPIPARAKLGGIERRRTWALRVLLVFGLALVICGELPHMRQWARGVPPLTYLSWVGGGIAALTGLGSLLRWLGVTRHRYIRNGIPLVARVVDLVKAPVIIVSGEATHYAFTAMVEYRSPHTNELEYRQLMSPHFGSRNRDEYTTSFKIGDYVTAVYLPGKYPKSLQLFGFLDLVPGLGVIRRPKSGRARVLWRAPLMTVAVIGIFAILFWNIYAFDCLYPFAFDYRKSIAPIFAGGTSLTALFVGGTWIGHRRDQRRAAERNARAIAQGEAVELGAASFWAQRGLYGFVIKALAIPGMFLIGGLTTLCWCFTANSLLDKSPAVLKVVEIDGIKGRTVTFRFPGAADAHEVFVIRGKPLDFPGREAIAEMHEGRLGWPWVKELRPEVPRK